MKMRNKSILLVIVVAVFQLELCDGKKNIDIAVFLDDDDQYQISTIAISSAVRRINLFSQTDFLLRPHIDRINKNDLLKTGKIACDLLQKGIAAIFGPESPEVNELIQSVSTTLHIPQFQTFWNTKLNLLSNEPQQVFNLYPSPRTLSKALATLVRENDWKSYTVIYENDDGLLRLQEALKQRNPSEPAVAFRKLGPKENHRSILKEIQSTGALRLILDCEKDHILDILREARELKLLSEYHSYILTNLDAHTLDWSEFRNLKTNISALRMLDPKSEPLKTATLVWNQILNFEFDSMSPLRNLTKQNNVRFIREPRPSIVPEQITTKTALLYDALNLFITVFSKLEAKEELILKPLSCEKYETSSHGLRFSKALKEIKLEKGLLMEPLTGTIQQFDNYGYRTQYQLQIVEFDIDKFIVAGSWNPKNPDKINLTLTVEDRDTEQKKRIQHMTFKVVSRLGAPYLIRRTDPNGRMLFGNDRFEGYAMDLMKEICRPQHLNCSYTFELVSDGHYGNYDPKTKKWDGLIKDLLELRADLAVCDLTITYERRKAVDFTMPFMTLGISILYAKAVKEPPDLLSFSHPFSLDVWLYIATAYLLISIIIFLVARLNPSEWENPHPCNPSPQELENIWNIRNCCWLTMGSFMTQGCDILPKGISTRMVAAMWWFFVLILTACYTANMTAFLTMSRMGPTIESAEDLAAQTKIKYGSIEGGATASFFKDTNFSTYHRMWVQMESAEPSVFETSNKDGVKRVLTSKRKYAFLMESAAIEYEMERNCELMQVGNNLDSKSYGIAMRTDVPYRKSINEVILKLQEMGVLVRMKDKWWKEMHGGGQCTKDKSSEDEAATELGLDHVGGAFVVLAAGMLLALLIAICEFLWNVRKVAVVERLTPKEAFVQELKFATNIWARKKAVLRNSSAAMSMDKME